jgi:ADP-L-glycero-D-manno-heptose 6-epimerase
MIIVTGGAGFVGSNLVKALNERGREDVLVVDDVHDGRKLQNLVDCEVFDLVDPDVLREWLLTDRDLDEPIEAVFHQGACADTMDWDGRAMMRSNYDYSKLLLSYCTRREIPFIYASSAAVYGGGKTFREERQYEAPLNPYGYSKFLFDQLTRRLRDRVRSQVAGLRYFNVYGPRESHKDEMASVAYKMQRQLARGEAVTLFEGSDGYAPGEQKRDFVWVGDCVAVNLWLLDHHDVSGIFNVGCGRARTFNDLASTVIQAVGRGTIEYVPFPQRLRKSYQSFTEADVSALRKAGYTPAFQTLEEAVPRYVAWLSEH